MEAITEIKGLDALLKKLDKRNFFVPGFKILWKIVAKIMGLRLKDYRIHAIAQSHLDASWLWRRKETLQKNYKTFTMALRHMNEYPFFKFSNTSPQYYYWMEKLTPDIFEDVKRRVAEGRFELIGGMWVEPDLNVISGESLIRQRLYGQRYYLERFGKMSNVGFLSDCFGFTWQLPQILTKSGAKYFYTNKLSWNDYTKHPFILFHWQSPDGSRILTYSVPYTMNNFIQKPNIGNFDKFARFFPPDTQFNYDIDYKEVKQSGSPEHVHDIAFIYGLGDGGGGPIRPEIIFFKQLMRLGYCDIITMEDYFKIIEKDANKFATWNDELYLEFHRGVYTSHVWLKELNRAAEIQLQNVDLLSTLIAHLGLPYPGEKLEQIWKLVLFNQFHDILPGSSIPEVYEDVRSDYEKINLNLKRLQQKALDFLISKISIPSASVVIFNLNGWQRSDLVSLSDVDQLEDAKGQILPAQMSHNGSKVFQIQDIPAHGYVILKKSSKAASEVKSELKVESSKTVITLENESLVAEINKETGNLKRLFSKTFKRELLTMEGNEVLLYKEKQTGFAAWDIESGYTKRRVHLDPQTRSLSCEILESGPLQACVKIIEQSGGLVIEKLLKLRPKENILHFTFDIRGVEKAFLVKLQFPFNIETEKVTSEIACGTIDRHIQQKTKAQKARWEMPCLRWVDFSDAECGVTVCNKARHGFDARYHKNYKSILRMTIGRRPKYPRGGSPIMSIFPSSNFHEQDEFHVDYSIVIHGKGNWKENSTYQHAIDLNNPLLVREVDKTTGKFPATMSFFTIEPANILLSTLKMAEDDKEHVIMRIYETIGKETTALIGFNGHFDIQDAEVVDLLEFNPEKIAHENPRELKVKVKPYEILTLKLKLSVA